MFFLMQKLLEFSLTLDKSKSRILRFGGKLSGIVPVWYARRMERRLKNGTWKPLFTNKHGTVKRQRHGRSTLKRQRRRNSTAKRKNSAEK